MTRTIKLYLPTREGIALFLMIFLLSGCSGIPITVKDGTTHHIIVGVGIVSCPAPAKDSGVLATKVEALGIHLSDQPGLKFATGYARSSVVSIPESANHIIVEVSQRPFGPLRVEFNPAHEGVHDER